jgi:phosphoglycolate phosphatase
MKPAVIFDLDGTLIDSVPDIHASANRAFAPLGQSFSRAEVQGFVGRGAPNLISRLAQSRGLPGTGAAFDDLLARFLEIYEQSHGLTALYPGVPTALDDLARTGARLGICTNKPIGPTRAVLAHFGLGCFGAVVGGDSLPVKKPDPAPLLHVLDLLGGGPVIFVGDSEVDAETAQAARVPFLLFTEGYRKAPVEAMPHRAAFADFAELPALVAGISASVAP